MSTRKDFFVVRSVARPPRRPGAGANALFVELGEELLSPDNVILLGLRGQSRRGGCQVSSFGRIFEPVLSRGRRMNLTTTTKSIVVSIRVTAIASGKGPSNNPAASGSRGAPPRCHPAKTYLVAPQSSPAKSVKFVLRRY